MENELAIIFPASWICVVGVTAVLVAAAGAATAGVVVSIATGAIMKDEGLWLNDEVGLVLRGNRRIMLCRGSDGDEYAR